MEANRKFAFIRISGKNPNESEQEICMHSNKGRFYLNGRRNVKRDR